MSRMGVLGALRGLGEGIQTNSQRAVENERRDIDYARQMRLEQIRQEGSDRRAKLAADTQISSTQMAQEGADGRAQIAADTQVDVALLREEGANDRSDATIASRESEGRANRESSEKIAGMRADAAGASAHVDAIMDQFQARSLKESQADPVTGMLTEVEKPAVFHKPTGRYFVQQGNKFVLPDVDLSERPQPPREALDALVEDPKRFEDFLDYYGFLPAPFFSALMRQ